MNFLSILKTFFGRDVPVGAKATGHGSTMADMLIRLARRGTTFSTVIDVGAAVGGWSADLEQTFPDKKHLLIEANAVHRDALADRCRTNRKWDYVLKACGREPGTVFFDGSDPFGGAASDVATESASQSLESTSIDHEVGLRGLKGPFLIKLDTHGYEIPILQGAVETLSSTELLILEVYNFQLHKECLRFWEICRWLQERNFLPVDLFDILYRPKDGALWQFDVVFARAEHPLFSNNTYR